MTDLGPEWNLDDEGIPSRKGARLLIFDASGRVLLIRGHDTHDVDHRWWFSVGGGIEPGEDPLLGAIREAKEETGFDFDPAHVQGPVIHRQAEFRFRNVLARQEEVFYIARLEIDAPRVADQSLTALEHETLDEFRWFSADELRETASHHLVYPLCLPDLVARWEKGWDGVFVDLGADQEGEDYSETPPSSSPHETIVDETSGKRADAPPSPM